LDPLDPLAEIIKSGQGFSPSIALERILWVMMGFFFLGAISTSFIRGMKQNNWFSNNSFLSNLKANKREDKLSNKLSDDDQ
jgi:preprotein translocase subunit SecG